MGRVLGVDGCPGGWVVARVDEAGVAWSFFAHARDLLAVDADVIGIDIPVGFPEHGVRGCEAAARTRLGVARSSVFLVPPRPVVETVGYPQANTRAKELTGKGLMSRQPEALFVRMRQVDEVADDPRWVEVHPEVSFRAVESGLADALDALAVAWSARRWLRGTAEVLPGEPPPYDRRGRPMRIVV
ncbi:MAG: DUF429 domain-containing protein [Actinomycetota bacterium]|nr:DUF429 domain-containing protein [Actinomycetota bacterium]